MTLVFTHIANGRTSEDSLWNTLQDTPLQRILCHPFLPLSGTTTQETSTDMLSLVIQVLGQ